MKTSTKLQALLLSALAINSSPAQTVPGWRYYFARVAYPFERPDGEMGHIGIRSGHPSSTAYWYQDFPDNGNLGREASLSLPFDAFGDILGINALTDGFLASGYSSSTDSGRLVLFRTVRSPSRAMEILATADLPGTDPWRCTWNAEEQALYLNDGLNGRLLRSTWNGQPPLPTSYTTILDTATVANLSYENSAGSGWYLRPIGGGGVAYGDSYTWYDIVNSGGTWSVVGHTLAQEIHAARAPRYRLASPETANALGPLRLSGPVGSFEVVDYETSEVVATGSNADGDAWFDFPLISPLRAGRRHLVRSIGSTHESDVFLPLPRHGQSTVSDGLAFGRAIAKLGRHRVGDDLFSMGCDLRAILPPPGLQSTSQVWLWINVTLPVEPPPIAEIGGVTVLLASAAIGPQSVTVTDHETIALLGIPVPIPNEPALENCRIHGQFAAVGPTGGVLVSEILAVDIWANGTSAARAGARSGSNGNDGPTRALRRTAVDRFHRELDSGTGLAIYREYVARLRRR